MTTIWPFVGEVLQLLRPFPLTHRVYYLNAFTSWDPLRGTSSRELLALHSLIAGRKSSPWASHISLKLLILRQACLTLFLHLFHSGRGMVAARLYRFFLSDCSPIRCWMSTCSFQERASANFFYCEPIKRLLYIDPCHVTKRHVRATQNPRNEMATLIKFPWASSWMNLKGSLHDFWHIIPLPWMAHNGAHCTNGMYILSKCVCISVLGDKKHKLFLSIFYAKLNFRDVYWSSPLVILFGWDRAYEVVFGFLSSFPPTRKVNICTCCCRPEKMSGGRRMALH